MRKTTLLLAFVAPLFLACGSDDDNNSGGSVTPVTPPSDVETPNLVIVENMSLNISTDKALYKPGETVHFSAEGTMPSGAKVRYRKGSEVIAEVAVSGKTWDWTAPSTDYTGYMADVYVADSKGETIYGTVAIDVSSDWSRFPRYGFVSTYDASKTQTVIDDEMAFLNRLHINGVQFYDWHNKPHWPLGGTRDNLLNTYADIANRQVSTSVVKNYISRQHTYGMKAMFYNLCFGALGDATADGVDEKWSLYKNTSHQRDFHGLPSGWKGDIYLMNPANTDWQSYIAERNDDVYHNFDFDGYHIDQLGSRGDLYDYYGAKVDLPKAYNSFIKAMKARHANKRLVMNAVSGYGVSQIGASQGTDFMYTEMWANESQFNDIRTVISNNSSYSEGKNTIIAGYMNYNKSGSAGTFNTPGILLTDAVIFALGGAHLEMGDGHMLCHEYFPNNNLKMSADLKKYIVRYYDFLVAYQNLLRDGGAETTPDIASTNSVSINAWPPKMSSVTAYAKTVGSRKVIHLLNFMQANNLSWRDLNGDMPEPKLISNLPLKLKASGVKKLWIASPDKNGGIAQQLSFKQNGAYITFTLPSLKYWTMIVVEN